LRAKVHEVFLWYSGAERFYAEKRSDDEMHANELPLPSTAIMDSNVPVLIREWAASGKHRLSWVSDLWDDPVTAGLTKWNSEWDQLDPLCGKQGWSLRHYANFGILVVLCLVVVCLWLPSVIKMRSKLQLQQMTDNLREAEFDDIAGEMSPVK